MDNLKNNFLNPGSKNSKNNLASNENENEMIQECENKEFSEFKLNNKMNCPVDEISENFEKSINTSEKGDDINISSFNSSESESEGDISNIQDFKEKRIISENSSSNRKSRSELSQDKEEGIYKIAEVCKFEENISFRFPNKENEKGENTEEQKTNYFLGSFKRGDSKFEEEIDLDLDSDRFNDSVEYSITSSKDKDGEDIIQKYKEKSINILDSPPEQVAKANPEINSFSLEKINEISDNSDDT